MAYFENRNVKVAGIAACVPAASEENSSLELFRGDDYQRFVTTTGIEQRRIAPADCCASDLCHAAAEKLLEELEWEREEVDALIFVSQTPDYLLPATSCILQQRLGLSRKCMALDISLGCSGWVYGLTVLSSMMSTGNIRKALLLSGDTVTKTKSPRDKTTYPLFGDAGSATALIYEEGAQGILSTLYTDGKGYSTIMIEDGGYRNPFNASSLEYFQGESGGYRNRLQSHLDGTSVFTFGISKAPACVKYLAEHFGLDLENTDQFIFHQANMLMNEKIRTKLKLPEEKVPYSLRDFGNTSSVSIPLTMVTRLAGKLRSESLDIIACGFGVGLSWGAVHFNTTNITCPELIEL